MSGPGWTPNRRFIHLYISTLNHLYIESIIMVLLMVLLMVLFGTFDGTFDGTFYRDVEMIDSM